MESDDPIQSHRKFLEHFSNQIDNLSQNGDEGFNEAPFSPNTRYIVPSEVEGECLEWTRKYLSIQ